MISCEHVTRDEIFSHVLILSVDCTNKLANIPQKVFLEYALTCNAEFRAECIQSRFGGVGLPTTIKDGHAGVINHGDLVTVQVYSGHAVVGDDLGVARRPVLACLDSSDHLGFDLTHGVEWFA